VNIGRSKLKGLIKIVKAKQGFESSSDYFYLNVLTFIKNNKITMSKSKKLNLKLLSLDTAIKYSTTVNELITNTKIIYDSLKNDKLVEVN
jgi:hypothetical protein